MNADAWLRLWRKRGRRPTTLRVILAHPGDDHDLGPTYLWYGGSILYQDAQGKTMKLSYERDGTLRIVIYRLWDPTDGTAIDQLKRHLERVGE
jgi:hypothetical protein